MTNSVVGKLTSHQLLILLELVDCLLGNGGGAAGGLRVRRDLPPQSRSGSCNSSIDCDLEGKLSFYDQLVGEICVISICRRLLKNKLKHRNIITKQGVFQDGSGFSTNVQYICTVQRQCPQHAFFWSKQTSIN